MAALVHDGDRHEETPALRLRHAALDARDRLRERHETSTWISPSAIDTGYVATLAPRPGKTHCPVRTS